MLDVVLMGGEHYWKALDLLLPETDVFLPNDDESKLLTGLDDPIAQAERFRQSGAKTVVITQGSARQRAGGRRPATPGGRVSDRVRRRHRLGRRL